MPRTLRDALLGAFVVWAGLIACKGDRGPAGPAGPAGTQGPGGTPSTTAQNLNVALTAARVTADRKVQVDYTLTDPAGGGIAFAGDVASSWTLAVLSKDPDNGIGAWQSLILAPVTGAKGSTSQPTSETSGTVENLGGGKYRYTYAAVLPDGYDASATYRAAVFQRRPIPNTANLNDVANGILDFVPNGGTPAPRDLVSTQACNTCHTTLKAHGGFRRETRLCATCHTTQLVDPDTNDTGDPSKLNPLELGRLVHRIHRGKALPTVVAANAAHDETWAYHVIGFRGSDNVYGSVVKNRNPAAAAATPTITAGVGFPRDLRGCAVCHAPAKDAQGNVVYGSQSDEWKTAVSRRTCQSCHDSSWFQDGSPPLYHVLHQKATNPGDAGVAGLVQTDDSQCKTCHSDVLMTQAHTSPFASADFNPLTLKIDSVSVTTPPTSGTPGTAGSATVTFTITNKDGSPVTSLATLGSAAINVSGPTKPDFSGSGTDGNIVNVNVKTAATPTATPGQYAAPVTLPAGATGTWAAGLEARRTNTTLTNQERKLGHIGATATFNDFGVNPVAYFNVSGTGAPQLRRKVVAFENCNVCHETLSVHGGTRHDPQYCVMCHSPDNSDVARRPANPTATALDKLPERSIHLKPMIHSIHTGEELVTQKPFVIYGFGGSANFFDEVRFPSSRTNCKLCHLPSTFTLDSLPTDALPSRAWQIGPATQNADGSLPVAAGGLLANVPGSPAQIGPITSACVSCHDTPETHAHATAMTQIPPGATTPVETCRICHSENAEFPVSRMHSEAGARQ